MNAPLRSAALIAALIVSSYASPAAAQGHDFTITVPVNVTGLPSNISEMYITCYIAGVSHTDDMNEIAFLQSRFRVSGSYHGNVTMTADALAGKDPAEARFYTCTGQFFGTDRGVSTGFFVNGATTPPVFALVAGAPFYLGSQAFTPIPGTH